MKRDVQHGPMYMNATVVLDITKFAKAVYEFAHSGSCSANHLSESLVCNRRNHRFGLLGLPKLGHEEEESCKALLAVIEELFD
jgi:hypothetical protein